MPKEYFIYLLIAINIWSTNICRMFHKNRNFSLGLKIFTPHRLDYIDAMYAWVWSFPIKQINDMVFLVNQCKKPTQQLRISQQFMPIPHVLNEVFLNNAHLRLGVDGSLKTVIKSQHFSFTWETTTVWRQLFQQHFDILIYFVYRLYGCEWRQTPSQWIYFSWRS